MVGGGCYAEQAPNQRCSIITIKICQQKTHLVYLVCSRSKKVKLGFTTFKSEISTFTSRRAAGLVVDSAAP